MTLVFFGRVKHPLKSCIIKALVGILTGEGLILDLEIILAGSLELHPVLIDERERYLLCVIVVQVYRFFLLDIRIIDIGVFILTDGYPVIGVSVVLGIAADISVDLGGCAVDTVDPYLYRSSPIPF